MGDPGVAKSQVTPMLRVLGPSPTAVFRFLTWLIACAEPIGRLPWSPDSSNLVPGQQLPACALLAESSKQSILHPFWAHQIVAPSPCWCISLSALRACTHACSC